MKNLNQIKKKYPNEWLAFKVMKETSDGCIQGKLIFHHPDRRTLHVILRRKRTKGVYITYSGPLVKSGYAVMF